MRLPKDLQELQCTPEANHVISILDALESVTNGMENPGILEQIERVPPGSPLRPYAELVLALKGYYENDPPAVKQRLSAIPDSSPPAQLKPLLSYLCGLTEEVPSRPIDREILKALGQRKSALEIALEESLQMLALNHEEGFSDSVAYLVRELYGTVPEYSKRLTLWALRQFKEKDWDGDLFGAHLGMILGDTEACRLRALSSLQGEEPDCSQEWGLFLGKLLRTGQVETQTVEAAVIIWIYLREKTGTFTNQDREVIQLLQKKYPQVAEKLQPWLTEASPPSSPKGPRGSRKKSPYVQLELSF